MSATRVLVVEDAPEILMLVTMLLEDAGGFEVTGSGDGAEALALALDSPPDVVLLDYHLPTMDGPEVLAALRADPATRSCRVVLFTAGRRPEEELLALGPDALLPKPFTADALVAALRQPE